MTKHNKLQTISDIIKRDLRLCTVSRQYLFQAKRIAHSKKWYECVPCDLKADEGEGREGRVLQSTVRRAEKGHSKVMDRHATHPSPPNHGQSPAMTAEQGIISRGWGVVLSGGGVHVKHNVAHVDENSKSKLMTHTALANDNDGKRSDCVSYVIDQRFPNFFFHDPDFFMLLLCDPLKF